MLSCSAPVWTPAGLDEALALRARHPEATVLAGGTDVLVALEASQLSPSAVLNLWGCPGLRGVEGSATTGLRLGALTTFADLIRHPETPDVLRDCARTVGAAQIQSRATVGGNIANASPAGDSLPLWLALDASFELASVRLTRTVPASSFFLGYRKIALAPDELLTAVIVPAWRGRWGADRLVYRKVGTRLFQAISKVVLGGRLRVVDGVVTEARVALGSVAPTPVRCAEVERALVGAPVRPEAADRIVADIAPIDDVRSTAAYRMQVATNIVRSWLIAETGEPS